MNRFACRGISEYLNGVILGGCCKTGRKPGRKEGRKDDGVVSKDWTGLECWRTCCFLEGSWYAAESGRLAKQFQECLSGIFTLAILEP